MISKLQFRNMNPDSLLVYIRNKTISDAARRQLQQIADLKTQIVTADAERTAYRADIDSTTRDEDRNRENIASLSRSAGSSRSCRITRANWRDQETQIARLRDRQTALEKQRSRFYN